MSIKPVVDLDAAFLKRHGIPDKAGVSKRLTAEAESRCDLAYQFDAKHNPKRSEWQYDPVGFTTFCESREHMHLTPRKATAEAEAEGTLSARQYKDCLAILGNDPLRMFEPDFRKYTFGGLCWAKGSGKDFVCSIIHAYITHILLCMKNPQDFFGFTPGEPCDVLNVGKKGQQAERVYFSKFRARLLTWEWMLTKYNVTDEGKRFRHNGRNFPNCKVGTRSAEWLDKHVRAFAENSGNEQSLEGYNIVFFICDEISGWLSDVERDKAKKILNILRTSQSSRNTKRLAGLGLAISYPRQDDDIMFEIEKESQQVGSHVFFSRGYQWEIKPKWCYGGKTFKFNAGTEELPEWFDIPTELDEDFFRKNPEQAKGMYLLRPPAVQKQYFEYLDKIEAVSYATRQPLLNVATEYIKSVDGQGKAVTYIRRKILGLNRQPQMGVDYVVWLDAAETTCDAALSIGHLENVSLIEGSERKEVQAVVLDQTVVWEPDEKNKIIVDIGSMTALVLDLKKYITIKAAWWDQWNSGTGMFDFRQAGINCDKHNLTGDNYDFFKGIIYTHRFVAPKCDETDKGIGQLKHLSRTRTGNVTPGSSLHKKDVVDTWCGINQLLLGGLAQTTYRAGQAPASIKIGGPPTGMGGSAAQTKASNPFSQPGGGSGMVRDHSDMFRNLMPGGAGGRGIPGVPGRTRNSTPATTKPTQSKFPRGIRM